MISFKLLLNFCEEPEESWRDDPDWDDVKDGFEGYLVKVVTWPTLLRTGEHIRLLGLDESTGLGPKVEYVSHGIYQEGAIEVVCEGMEMKDAALAIMREEDKWEVEEADEAETHRVFLMLRKFIKKKD